jgi:PKD domain
MRLPNTLLARISILAIAGLSLSACAGSKRAELNHGDPTAPGLLAAGLSLTFPAPSALPVSAKPSLPRSASAAEILLNGDQSDSLLPRNWCFDSVFDTRGHFQPYTTPGGPLSNSAYAVFSMDVSAYTGPEELHLAWASPLPEAGDAWVGLANYVANRWDWFALPADGVLPVALAGGDYQNGAGLLRVAVLVVAGAGEGEYLLDSIGLTGNTPPVASFGTLEPYTGSMKILTNIHDIALLDASNSWDPDGSIVKYEFDPEGDGTFFDKGLVPNITHNYIVSGDSLATLRVTDNEGAVSTFTLTVTTSWINTIRGGGLGNEAADVAITLGGNLLCVGTLDGLGQGNQEAFLGYYDINDGAVLWERTYGTPQHDGLYDAEVDSSGYIYACGSLYGDGTSAIPVLLKLGPGPDLIWQSEWNFSCQGRPRFKLGSNNDLYFAAEIYNGVGNQSSLFIAKLDLDGNISWQREYSRGDDSFLGGICVDTWGNVYLAGSGYGFMPFGKDALLVSFDSSGNLRFDKYLDGGGEESLTGMCWVQNAELMVGGIQDTGSWNVALMGGVNTDGALSWLKTYTTGPSDERFWGEPLRTDTGCVYSGVSRDSGGFHDAMLLSVALDGAIEWESALGTAGQNDQNLCVCRNQYGRIFMGGRMPDQSIASFSDLSGTVADLSLSFTDVVAGSVMDNGRSLSPGTATYADMAGAARGSGGAMIAEYFPPVVP